MANNTFSGAHLNQSLGGGASWSAARLPAIQAKYFGGTKAISGLVSDAAGLPHARRVSLFLYPEMFLIALQTSDATTGRYAFDHMKPRSNGSYFVTAHDPARIKGAAIADILQPS